MKILASQMGHWPKIIFEISYFFIFEMLIKDGILERAKKTLMFFTKYQFLVSFF